MATVSFNAEIKIKWWFTYLYLPGFIAMHSLMLYLNPAYKYDFGRLDYWLRKAVTITLTNQVEGKFHN